MRYISGEASIILRGWLLLVMIALVRHLIKFQKCSAFLFRVALTLRAMLKLTEKGQEHDYCLPFQYQNFIFMMGLVSFHFPDSNQQ